MRRLFLNRSEPAKKSGQNIPKNRCRTTIAEPIGRNASGTAPYRGSGRLLKPRTRPPAAERHASSARGRKSLACLALERSKPFKNEPQNRGVAGALSAVPNKPITT